MAIEDTGWTPEALAAAIHHQLGEVPAPIQVHAIARALDIEEIIEKPVTSFEGCLVTDPERDGGVIMVNSASSYARRRYTVAHELGHFLCSWHVSSSSGFRCSRRDMTLSKGNATRDRQEAEANRFAIELLAPERLLRKNLTRLPELERVLSVASELDISKVAAARRYVELHRSNLAVMFAQHDRVLYVTRGPAFPWLPFEAGDCLPDLPGASPDEPLSQMVDVDPRDWLRPGASSDLAVQILRQECGHAIVLLQVDER